MDGTSTLKLRGALAALGLFALAGSIGAVSAGEPVVASVAVAPDSAADLPRFQPTAGAFEAQFAAYGDPAPVSAMPEAVDIAALAPAVEQAEDLGTGVASWYGREFAGRRTANGERFDPAAYTAAHRTLPFGSKVRVKHGDRTVVVRINDRGPFHGNRVIDLSQAAASELGLVRAGSGRVELALLDR